MKILQLFLLSLFFLSASISTSEAQLLKRLQRTAERAAENAVHRKVYQKTDEAVEEILKDPEQREKEEKARQQQEEYERQQSQNGNNPSGVNSNTSNPSGSTASNENVAASSFAAYSKYDFIPGDEILHYEDFSRSNVGDFPTGWNTLGSAEIVTTNNTDSKWIRISNATGGLIPFNFTTYPENFTLELDLIHDLDIQEYGFKRNLSFIFTAEADPEVNVNRAKSSDNQLAFNIDGGIGNNPKFEMVKYKAGARTSGNDVKIGSKVNVASRGEVLHLSFWRQGKRMRVYLEGDKIYDIPLAWSGSEAIQAFRIFSEMSREDESYYVSNIRMATGAPDTRSKLITEGRMVTYGITFASNSADVQPVSYGTLKSIATVLKENPTVKVNIIGHTDGDGDEAYNLKLSEDRAAAVKTILIKEFDIKASQLETEGKGESSPVADNSSPEGKAKNRRVELVKM